MKPFAGRTGIRACLVMMALAAFIAAGIPSLSRSEELLNRRDQARQAFLATPEGLYRHYCAHCHGENAKGGGRLWTSDLPSSPTDLTALKADKQYLIAAIQDGSGAHGKSSLCPPWGRTITAANIERLAQYIVFLESQTSQPASQPTASFQPIRESFPWLLLAVVLGEIVLLGWVLRRKRKVSYVVPQDPLVRG